MRKVMIGIIWLHVNYDIGWMQKDLRRIKTAIGPAQAR